MGKWIIAGREGCMTTTPFYLKMGDGGGGDDDSHYL